MLAGPAGAVAAGRRRDDFARNRGLTEVQVAFSWLASRPSVASGVPELCCKADPVLSGRRGVGLAPS